MLSSRTNTQLLQAEEMAQTFRQRIAQAEAMARADMLRFQPEVCALFIKLVWYSHVFRFLSQMRNVVNKVGSFSSLLLS